MNKLIALVLTGVVLAATPVVPAFAADSALCGPDGPEGYKRPGGFCEQLSDTTNATNGEAERRAAKLVSEVK